MTNVSLYDSFFQSNPASDWGSISMLLAVDTYVFSATHALSDITPSECTDASYSRGTGEIANDSSGTGNTGNYGLGSKGLSFPAMSVANWRFAIALDNSGRPLFCVDAGSTQTLSAEVLTANGQAFTITGV